MKINILHLYYDILNLYGEYGNVLIMQKHLEDQGFIVNVDKLTINDKIDFSKYDFIYLGCGTEKNLDVALSDLLKRKKEFKKAIDSKTVILMTGNSYEMLGHSIDDKTSLEILPFITKRLEDRITNDVIYSSSYITANVVGFVNKMTEIENNDNPLFDVVFGIGENKENKHEGVIINNLYGTHISGPILARNPEFLKLLVTKVCERVDKNFEYKDIEYTHEEASYDLVLKELMKRKENQK